MNIKVSIIVINYRTAEMTLDCVRSILDAQMQSDFEIIVVDNDSQDGSYEQLKSAALPRTSALESPTNGGFSHGNNFGAEASRGEYLFFFNSDTLMKPYVLDEMLAYMDYDLDCGALTCQSVDRAGDYLANGHPFPSVGSLFQEVIVKPRIPSKMRALRRNVRTKTAIPLCTRCDWISGSGLLMRRGDFDAIGRWDETYFMYMEDVSLCQEVKQLGKYCGIYNKLGFVHYLGDGAGSPKVIYEAARSELLYFRKYRPEHPRLVETLVVERARTKCQKSCPSEAQAILQKIRRFARDEE